MTVMDPEMLTWDLLYYSAGVYHTSVPRFSSGELVPT
jgi:hypothetical protein